MKRVRLVVASRSPLLADQQAERRPRRRSWNRPPDYRDGVRHLIQAVGSRSEDTRIGLERLQRRRWEAAGIGAVRRHIPTDLKAGATRMEIFEILVQFGFGAGLPTSIGALQAVAEAFLRFHPRRSLSILPPAYERPLAAEAAVP